MSLRLGLDIGTNSIGWALLELREGKPSSIVRTGVRIFSDGRNPKDGASLAVTRRLARQQRRTRDRKLKRQERLMDALVCSKLMPLDAADRKSLEQKDPYEIRSRALHELVQPFELGRALFHVAKRRGFKSNRKVDSGDSESGIIATSITATREQMTADGARTYGEWLYLRRQKGLGVLARTTGQGANKAYEVYSDRALTEDEVDQLFETQRGYGAQVCSHEIQKNIKDLILFQRDLLPVSAGKCTFERSESRGASADLRVQEFRIFQELNNLRIIYEHYDKRPLTIDERDKLAEELEKRPKLTMVQLKKMLALSDKEKINFEGSRDFLVGNQTSNAIANKKIMGKAWYEIPYADQISIVELLINEESEEDLTRALKGINSLEPNQVLALLSARLIDGYGRVSIKAISKILPHMKNDVITYDKAAAVAGYNHSDFYTGEWHKSLPYYGAVLSQYTGTPVTNSSNKDEATYGRIANPTVHIALNQIRKIVNAIIKKYGHPYQIHIEVVRDLKMSQKAKTQLAKLQRENQNRNDRYREKLAELGLKDSFDNRLRLSLWEELADNPIDRRCVFSGDLISIEKLFSAETQIEHLIPFADCLDDSRSNKTLASRKANNDKGKRTPYEAFGSDQGGYCWSDILDRADRLPPPKQRRFAADARTQFSGDEWLSRQLNDTAYISRVAREYITAVCNPNQVKVTPGRLTALFRSALGLNELLSAGKNKDRTDHRHHAIDAVVVALTEPSLIKSASQFASNDAIERLSERLQKIDRPWSTFNEDIYRSINSLVVSHKPDHGVQAGLHNDTAYGLVESPTNGEPQLVRYRKAITALKEKDLDKINDLKLANDIRSFTNASSESFDKAIAIFSEQSRAKKCTLEERLSVIPISDSDGQPYKAYKGDGNYCYEIERLADGSWKGSIITRFEANQHPFRSFLASDASRKLSFYGNDLVMRLCRDDIIAVESPSRQLLRIVKMSRGVITVAPIEEANVDARNRDPLDEFKLSSKSISGLQKLNARRVFVDVLGVTKDPGQGD